MKISIELQPCLKNRSGIGIYTYELTKRFKEFEDIQFQGDIFNFINRNNIDKDIPELKTLSKNICSKFPYSIYRRIWNWIPVGYNSLFKNDADIYHFFNYIVPPRIKGKVITTVYDMTYKLYPETMDKRNLKRLNDGMQYSVDRADKIITITESSKNDIVRFLNVEPSKIEIVPCGVDFNNFNRNFSENEKLCTRNKYNLPESYILYMGTLEPRKNIDSIIEAFALLKKQNKFNSIKLVIAGKKGWLFENIFNLVSKLKLEDNVVFTDYVAEIDKPIIYNMAKLFVFPSLYEGFGIPVIEAMASSIPVVTSNVSSLPEVAGDAAMLVEPKDVNAIAKMMDKGLSDEEFRQDLISKGKVQAQKFTWENSAEKLYNIYKEVMKQ